MILKLVAIDKSEEDQLAHYRTKGSRNGIRRFQDQNGKLTDEGYRHYADMYGWGKGRETGIEEPAASSRRSTANPEPSGYGRNVDVAGVEKSLKKKGVRESILREAHTIPKGTAIYRTTAASDDGTEGSTYVSYLDMDRQHYRGGWIRNQGKTGKAFEHTYTLNEDLHVPSRETSQKVVNEVMQKNPELVRETVKHWLDMSMPEGSWEREERIDNRVEDILMKEARKRGGDYAQWSEADKAKYRERAMKMIIQESVDEYGHMSLNEAAFFAMQTFGTNTKVRDQVVRELRRQGYNAMTDEASVGGRFGWSKEGGDPLIIFERKGLLSEQKTKEVSLRDERKSSNAYMKSLIKTNRNSSGQWSAIDRRWDEMLMHAEENGFDGTKTIQEIMDTLNDEQRAAVAYLLYRSRQTGNSGMEANTDSKNGK